jgi:hypothetical protein
MATRLDIIAANCKDDDALAASLRAPRPVFAFLETSGVCNECRLPGAGPKKAFSQQRQASKSNARRVESVLAEIVDQHNLGLLPAGLIKYSCFAIERGAQPERNYIEHSEVCHSMRRKIEKAQDRLALS